MISKREIKKNIEQAYLKKGQASYMLNDYESALKNFDKIIHDGHINNSNALIYEAHNYMGLSYYRKKDFEKAKGEYEKVIESKEVNSNSIMAYYNLGVVCTKDNKIEKAKYYFSKCLSEFSSHSTKLNGRAEKSVIEERAEKSVIEEQAEKARKALEKLDEKSNESDRGDWFAWWFGQRRFKKILGLAIITIVLIPFVTISVMIFTDLYTEGNTDTLDKMLEQNSDSIWLAVIVIGPLLMLLLPNFSRVKVGTVELEIQTPSAKKQIEQIEPQIDVIHSEMPTAYPMQSFRAAVQYSDVSTAFQNLSVVMPSKYEPNHALICKDKIFLSFM